MYPISAVIQYGDWQVLDALGEGASARVFRVRKDTLTAALKVFDPAIFREDAEAQERLSRQSALINHSIIGLIQILEIKNAFIDGRPAPAILMEFREGVSLEKIQARDSLSETEVRLIISSVARAAEELLKVKGIVHRDIKPANILFDRPSGEVTLLDTGVIRPLEDVNEVSGYAFVGTRRYSPPEFICRTHTNTLDCWQAITYYQLGATLYELATKKRPYESIKVEAQVTLAIQSTSPDYSALEFLPADIRSLIRLSLRRKWENRLSGLNWSGFTGLNENQKNVMSIPEDAAQKIIIAQHLISLDRENDLIKSLAILVGQIREHVLSNNCAIEFSIQSTRAELSLGPNAVEMRPLLKLATFASDDDLSILEITPQEEAISEYYIYSAGDLDGLAEVLAKKVSEYF